MQYGYRIIDDLTSGLQAYMAERGIQHLEELVGEQVSRFALPVRSALPGARQKSNNLILRPSGWSAAGTVPERFPTGLSSFPACPWLSTQKGRPRNWTWNRHPRHPFIKEECLSHHHVQHHHQRESDCETDGAEVGMITFRHFRNQLFYNDIQHGTCSKGEHVGHDA